MIILVEDAIALVLSLVAHNIINIDAYNDWFHYVLSPLKSFANDLDPYGSNSSLQDTLKEAAREISQLSHKYVESDFEYLWKTVDVSKAVKIGTLVKMAKKHNITCFTPPDYKDTRAVVKHEYWRYIEQVEQLEADAQEHPYFERKGLMFPHEGDCICLEIPGIPDAAEARFRLRDVDNNDCGVVIINGNGSKWNCKGTKLSGCFGVISDADVFALHRLKKVYVTEGPSDAARLLQSFRETASEDEFEDEFGSGDTAIVFAAGCTNLPKVVTSLRLRKPELVIVNVADNDDPGHKAAAKIHAEDASVLHAMPPKPYKDIDDYGRAEGSAAVVSLVTLAAHQPGIRQELIAVRTEWSGLASATPNNPSARLTSRPDDDQRLSLIEYGLRRPEICGAQLAFDQFSRRNMLGIDGYYSPFDNTTITWLRRNLERDGIPATKEDARDIADLVCQANAYNSIQEWASREVPPWDGVERLRYFHHHVLGTELTPYSEAAGMYLWTAIAARLLDPGHKCDIVIFWIGGQGKQKGTLLKAMPPHPEHYGEVDLAQMKQDDITRMGRGKLIIEANEGGSLDRPKQLSQVKAWITRSEDELIPKYKELPEKIKRTWIVVGTSNNREILCDETGNRRFAPIVVGTCDLARFMADKLQYYAEGLHKFREHGLQFAELERLAQTVHDDFRMRDAWEDTIADWLQQNPSDRDFVTVQQVAVMALHCEPRYVTRGIQMRIAKVLKMLNYVQEVRRQGDKTVRGWTPDYMKQKSTKIAA